MFLIVDRMDLVRSSAYYRGTWRKKAELRLWRAAEVEQADRERQKESERANWRAIREQWQQTTIPPFPVDRGCPPSLTDLILYMLKQTQSLGNRMDGASRW
jgi:hypothetical protein